MYRCITDLKGLIIDIDTFEDIDPKEWDEICQKFCCTFLSSKEENANMFEHAFGGGAVYRIEAFLKLFAPSQTIHETILYNMQLAATEVAYVSRNRAFLDNAMSFLGGTIWIANEISYEDVGKAPDLICRNFAAFKQLLRDNVQGFFGEVVTYPNTDSKGMIIPLLFCVDDGEVPLYMIGRYFGYSHYMSQLHPYSSAIFINKNERSKAYGKYNDIFSRLYVTAIKKIQQTEKIDGVMSVPTRPGKIERFNSILSKISSDCGITNLSMNFHCLSNYPTQKNLSYVERQENITGVFQYDGDLRGKDIVLIDDVITTGATMRECVAVLKRKGASKISIVVLAINQLQGYYWSSENAQVICNNCGEKMHLLINSNNGSFFYTCYSCHAMKSFDEGRRELCEQVNDEMK